jgi:glutamate--cysteine ligase
MTIDDVGFPRLLEGQPISEAEAEGWLPRTCFKHGPPGRTGIELEYLVHSAPAAGEPVKPPGHPDPDRRRRLIDDLERSPLDSAFSVEPGGQVELSSRPGDDLGSVVAALSADLAVVNETLARHGARLVGAGVDPLDPPARHLRGPRYTAMEQYLDRWGPAGRAMMRTTASVQVNVEAGRAGRGDDDLRRRWDLLHAAGPVLAATFSTGRSPAWPGLAGPRSAIWLALDPGRCRAPVVAAGESLPEAWARWVLDAPVAMVRRPDRPWTAPAGLTFRAWLRAGRSAVPDRPAPDLSDLQYHLTTLFPPVRARGHLEVRYLDAQPGRWWRVPAAVVTALLDDDVAQDTARAAVEGLADAWPEAAGPGLAHPGLRRAAGTVLAAAAQALDRAGHDDLARLTDEYLQRRPTDPADPANAEEVRPC